MGGFFGATEGDNIKRKIKILKDEAVVFDNDGKVNVKCIFDPLSDHPEKKLEKVRCE